MCLANPKGTQSEGVQSHGKSQLLSSIVPNMTPHPIGFSLGELQILEYKKLKNKQLDKKRIFDIIK